MNGFNFQDIFKHGWPIFSVMTVLSVVSVTVVVDRWMAFSATKMHNVAFIQRILELLKSQSYAEAETQCHKFRSKPLGRVVGAVLLHSESRESMDRALNHALADETHSLEKGIHILGTIAGTAPFIGLLGTVIGIIRCFVDISTNAGGGPDVVSAGIAEALIATAFGLLVAIPALMGYNYFVNRIQHISSDIEHHIYEVIEELATKREIDSIR